MRKIFGNPHRVLILAVVATLPMLDLALANDNNFYQNNTQYGVSLPNAALPSGSDEVRAADGTSCRSAIGGQGAYLDAGVIGAPGADNVEQAGAVYARIVLPLGAKPRRLDCASLYELEIQRLKMELDLARMGLSGQSQSTAPGSWQQEGWTNEGTNTAAPAAAAAPAKAPAKQTAKATVAKVTPVADAPIEVAAEIPLETIY